MLGCIITFASVVQTSRRQGRIFLTVLSRVLQAPGLPAADSLLKAGEGGGVDVGNVELDIDEDKGVGAEQPVDLSPSEAEHEVRVTCTVVRSICLLSFVSTSMRDAVNDKSNDI